MLLDQLLPEKYSVCRIYFKTIFDGKFDNNYIKMANTVKFGSRKTEI